MAFEIHPTSVDIELLSAFGDSLHLVGGRVRDIAMDPTIESKDSDYLIYGKTHTEIQKILEVLGYRTDMVGASFGVIKASKEGVETIDVSIPRREFSTGDGHKDFAVETGPEISVVDDLGRRDFPPNAMAWNFARKELIDPYGGMRDIKNHVLRAVSDTSMLEDPLRIMRAIQFAARFDMMFAPSLSKQISDTSHLLSTIVPERKQEELNKMLLKSKKPSLGWELIAKHGLLPYTIPEFEAAIGLKQNSYHTLDVWQHCLRAGDVAVKHGGDLNLRWGALLHDVGKPATVGFISEEYGNSFWNHEIVGADMTKEILDRLRFSSNDIDDISGLVRHHMYMTQDNDGCTLEPRAIRRFARRITENQPREPQERISRQFFIRMCDVEGKGMGESIRNGDHNDLFQKAVFAELEHIPPLDLKSLVFRGGDVIALFKENNWVEPNYKGDSNIKTCLIACLDAVIENPSFNTKEDLERIAFATATTIYGESKKVITPENGERENSGGLGR